jgi:hypothetical protein
MSKRILVEPKIEKINYSNTSEANMWTIVNIYVTTDMIKDLIRGENIEVHNEDMGNAAIVIRISDQEEYNENSN